MSVSVWARTGRRADQSHRTAANPAYGRWITVGRHYPATLRFRDDPGGGRHPHGDSDPQQSLQQVASPSSVGFVPWLRHVATDAGGLAACAGS